MNNKPLTYDQAFKPNMIGVTKGWQSSHTGNLLTSLEVVATKNFNALSTSNL